jgi:hypothetical protein
MRWFFLVFLVVNVLYFGWELDKDISMHARNISNALPVPPTATRLSLIREMTKPPRERSTQDTITTVNGGATARGPDALPSPADELLQDLPDIRPAGPPSQLAKAYCFTYGPLPEQSQATGLDDWFRSRHVGTRVRHTDGQGKELFWIYLAPKESREGAMEVLQELRSKGVSDYRLVRRGNLVNAISLGVFSSLSAVNKRLAELQGKGYKPVVVPYSGVNRIYWVDVKLESLSGDIEEIFSSYPSRFNSVPVNCDEIDIADAGP